MNKKMIAPLTCATMPASATTGCTSSDAGASGEGDTAAAGDGSGKVTTKVPDNYGGMVEGVISVYERLNPEANIEHGYASSDSYYSKSTTLNVANELLGMVMTNSQFIGNQAQSGLLVDLTDVVENRQNCEKDVNWGETVNPTLLGSCKATLKTIDFDYADKLYGILFTVTTMAVIYDKNVYKGLGLNMPPT